MSKRAYTSLLLALAAILTGCDDGDGVVQPGAGPGQISGTVAFVKTGQGVDGLVVVLLRGDSIAATSFTRGGGLFAFRGLEEGSYTVRLTGLEITGLDLRSTAFDPVEREVSVGPDPVDLTFAAVGLIPARVAGDVTCGGDLVPGVEVRVIGGQDTDETTETDASGRYSVVNLSEGYYAVIPGDAPCALLPAFRSVFVPRGASGEADFGG